MFGLEIKKAIYGITELITLGIWFYSLMNRYPIIITGIIIPTFIMIFMVLHNVELA